ncbi:MAG: MATE family efflux transporter [Porticoccus sp.]|nr:MATE family efflux transporter [Porticoccus sp.]
MASPRFVTGSLHRHIAVMTSTAALGLMAIFLVDLADIYFLSLLGETELAAAVGYAGSILFFTTTICIGISIAMAALVARAAGSGEMSSAKRYIASVSVFAVVVTVPSTLIVWLNIPFFLELLGATGRAHQLAALYLRIIVPSMPILALGLSMGGVLRALGDPKHAMVATIAGSMVNLVLDPILIFGLDMSVAGAAVASVVARITVLFIGVRYVINRQYMPSGLGVGEFCDDLGSIAKIAVPAMLTNVATPIGNAYVTASMSIFGDGSVAGFSIVSRIMPVAFGIIFALSGAVGPIIGQNFGAGRMGRVHHTLISSLIFSTAVVMAVSLLLLLMQNYIVEAFRAQPAAAALIQFFCTFIAISFIFSGAQFISNAAFNNLGRPLWSTWANWGKATLGTIPLVWLGAKLYGAEGILAGQAVGGVLFGVLSIVLALRLTRRLVKDKAMRGFPLTPGLTFRVPLSAHTSCNGWVGVYRRD